MPGRSLPGGPQFSLPLSCKSLFTGYFGDHQAKVFLAVWYHCQAEIMNDFSVLPESPEQRIAQLEHLLATEKHAREQAELATRRTQMQLQVQQRQTGMLETIATAANRSKDVPSAFQFVLELLCQHYDWPVGHVYLKRNEGELVSAGIWYLQDQDRYAAFHAASSDLVVAEGSCLKGTVLKNRRPFWLTDVAHTTAFSRHQEALAAGLHFGFAFPIWIGEETVGIIEVFSSRNEEPDQSMLDLVGQVGIQLGFVLDRERALRKVREREEYFRHLTQNALDLITILNGDGTIQYESPSMRQVLGWDEPEYLGRNAFEFVHQEDLPEVIDAFTKALRTAGSTPPLTFRFKHKNGSWRVLEGIGNNLLADPVVKGIVFNSRDITERKKLEAQFIQSQKVQAIGQLAGGVAHDFNNILTAIIGYSELVINQLPEGGKLRDNVRQIKSAADRAAGLTRQLLAFSRKQVLQPRRVNLNDTVNDMDKMLRRLLGEDIAFLTTLAPSLQPVKVDPVQIEQVILNLVVNARDAMQSQGRLTLQTAAVKLDEEYVRVNPDVAPADYIMLAVSDNGVGMTPEVRARLFEPFFTTKEVGKGTGLGLATCHGIIKQSGGHITCYSELGKGTTFKVYLPVAVGETEHIEREPENSAPVGGKETVLLVEDEPLVRELAVVVLRDLGYEVLEAGNGLTALALVRNHKGNPIQLVITDVVMPEMGGRQLAAELKQVLPNVKVLFCSGYTEDAVMHGGLLEPGMAFIGKPYTMTSLSSKARELLEQGLK
jgi:PAS domain S-box-containing protein